MLLLKKKSAGVSRWTRGDPELQSGLEWAAAALKGLRISGVKVYFSKLMQVQKVSSTVFTPLADGTGVLLHLETLWYYSLNRTGAAIWQLIEEKKVVALEDLIDITCTQFEVEHREAQRTLKSFLEKLVEFKMVQVT